MDTEAKLSCVLELFEKLGVTIRTEYLGGEGGGVCHFSGKHLFFMDLDADFQTQYASALSGLANIDGLDNMFILPKIRADLDKLPK